MSHAAWRKQEAEENRRLARMLRRALQDAGVAPELSRQYQILDLACGECREAETLVSVVQSLDDGGSRQKPSVRLVGTDIRDREVEAAARRFRNKVGAEFDFLVEDAAQLGRNRELGNEFDLAFLRHQNYWHDPLLWKKIFAQGLERLSEGGLLVITSYFDREHELATRALDEVGAELVSTHRNTESMELACPGKSVDRHVAVFRRKAK